MQTDAPLMSAPSKDVTIAPNEPRIYQSAVVSVIDWIHQSIVNDLAKLAADPSDMEVLDTFLGLRAPAADNDSVDEDVAEADRYFVADADPAQQKAVFRARGKNGLLIHGPPGTGKSQTRGAEVSDSGKSYQWVLRMEFSICVPSGLRTQKR